jgi:hypothetical protein
MANENRETQDANTQTQTQMHHHQDVVVQEEKDLVGCHNWHCTFQSNLSVEAENTRLVIKG